MIGKKILAALLSVCMILGCMSMTALALEYEAITVGQSKTITVQAGDAIVDASVTYSFTPEESGTYFMSVSYDESLLFDHGVWFYVNDGDDYFSFGDTLEFEATAGETCQLSVNYFGQYESDMEYVVTVVRALPLEGISLSAERDTGRVGDYLYIDVTYQPELGEREQLSWTVSDPAVARLEATYADYAELYLLSAGTVTVTATTAGGKVASIDITVAEVVSSEFVVGENKVIVSNGDAQPFTFVPEYSGYYTFRVDSVDAGCGLDAESVCDGVEYYYVLEAGETYNGEAYAWVDGGLEFTVTVEYHENLEFPVPVSMEITKLPDNTTYLKNTIQELWNDDLLAGMELKLTWADGTVTDWSFDENNGRIGIHYVGGFLNEKNDGGYEIEVYLSGDTDVQPVFFDLTVLDIVPQSIELVDATPLQIVENSCGIPVEQFDVWLYLPLAAYERQVKITFSDGTSVTAKSGDLVYGYYVECSNNQGTAIMDIESRIDGFWTKDSTNLVVYWYQELNVTLDVQIIDSPVERLEIVTPPTNDAFMIGEDSKLVTEDGTVLDDIRTLLDGIALKVTYKDGTVKTFSSEDFRWVWADGGEYPFLEDYPLGIFGGWILSMEEPVPPCEIEGFVEYMGVSATYPIKLVDSFNKNDDTDKPEIEPIPGTGDEGLVLGVVMLAGLMGLAVTITRKKEVC